LKKWKKINNKIKLASYYYFNHNLSYGPSFLGWMSNVYNSKKKWEKMIEKINNLNLENIEIKIGDFQNTIPQYNNTFMYLDPPYFIGGTSKTFAGIYPQRNEPIHHKDFDHLKLKNLLDKHKGGFILSYNDCNEIREFYKSYQIIPVQWQYTMGQGETRIGKNRILSGSNSHVKKSHEILIIGKKEI